MKFKNCIKNISICMLIFLSLSNKSYAIEEINNLNNGIQNKTTEWISNFTDMPTARQYLSSQIVDYKLYCIGGNDGSTIYDAVEIYDFITGVWTSGKGMPTARRAFTSVTIDEKIYCIGGDDGNSQLSSVEIYDTKTDTWSKGADMPTPRNFLSSVAVEDKIYCIGGNDGLYTNEVEVYDTKTNTWEIKTPIPTARDDFAIGLVDNKIYCIGGWGGPILKSVEIYDIETDTWSAGADMPTSRARVSGNVVDTKIYCIGGIDGGYLKSNAVEVYDTILNKWEKLESMPTAKDSFASSILNGKIYCIGGFASASLKSIDVFKVRDATLEELAQQAVRKAEKIPNNENIEDARLLVNSLPESIFKDELQDRLNNLFDSSMNSIESKDITSNADIYVKPKNTLIISLSTNSITFDDFSGVEDIKKVNAVKIGVSSSLQYQLNAYLPMEILNADKTSVADKRILNIKENSEADYKVFVNTNEKLVLKDNCPSGNNLVHGIDIKLSGGITHEKDVYKTTIKFEAEQK